MKVVGLLVESLTDRFWHEVVLAVAEAARRRGVRLFVFVGGTLDAPELAARQANRCYQLAGTEVLDGLIIAPLGSYAGPERLVQYVQQYRPLPMAGLTAVLSGVPSVCTDNVESMKHAVRHLIEDHGLHRIAFIRGPDANPEAEMRYSGYRRALQEAGIRENPDMVLWGDFSEQSGRRVIREMGLQGGHAPFEGIVAANDSMALGALAELQRVGVRVPDQVKVVSIDDVPEGRWGKPSLSTVRQLLGRLAEGALCNVLDQIDGKTVPALTLVAGELAARESCGCRAAFDVERLPARPRSSSMDGGVTTEQRLEHALEDVYPGGTEELPEEWRSLLAASLAEEIDAPGGGAFQRTLEGLLSGAAIAGRELGDWQRAVSALRDVLSAVEIGRVDEALYQARMQIGDVAERQQAALRIGSAAMLQQTIAAGSDVLGSFHERSLFDALSPHFPGMMVRCCFVSLYQSDNRWPPRHSRLVFAYRDGVRVDLPSEGQLYETRRLLPEHMLSHRPRAFTVSPLFFGDYPIGVVVFELGPPQGQVYEWLREQLSVALEGARLIRRIEVEVSERERAERERLERELKLAARIQTSVLPRELVVAGLEMAAQMVPATEVGGDCYDVISTEGGGWISMGDVAGHGLRPGVVMMMLQSSVAAVVRARPEQGPAEALTCVNGVLFDSIRHRLEQDEHATLMLIKYRQSGEFVFAGAHEEPIVYRASSGRMERLEAPGLWMAMRPDARGQMPETQARLAPGDLLLLYTDGVVEGRNREREQYGVERLERALASVCDEPVERIVEHLLESSLGWMERQRDDITLLVARQKPG